MSNFKNGDYTVEETRPNKRLKENVNVGDAVDDNRHSLNSWCPATVKFHGANGINDSVTVDPCGFRLHHDSINDVDWVPPLRQQLQEKPLEIEQKPKNLKIRIKKYTGKPNIESKFKKGEKVEVSSDEEGYKGAWFVASIVDTLEKDKFLVEYRDLMNDDGTQLLKEEINAMFIRPCPPHLQNFGCYKRLQEVDAWYNDGWWKGMVVGLLNRKECFVRFMYNEVLKFEYSKLRPHQDWFEGKWVISSNKESSELVKKFGDVKPKVKNLAGTKLISKCQIPNEQYAKQHKDVTTRTINNRSKFVLHFYKGAKVEVRSDEEGYEGSWFTATVVDFLQNGKYLVEYLSLKTDDLTEQLREEADGEDLRPYPPDINQFRRFVAGERVDAWYNDGWWVGQVSCVLDGFKYRVYFWTSNEELEFEHCHMRPHQEWIGGRWMLASLG